MSSEFKTTNVLLTQMNDGVSYEWESFEAFKADLPEIARVDPVYYADVLRSSAYPGDAWLGCRDGFDGVMSRIENGWPELREKAEKLMEGIELELPVLPSVTRQRRRKVRASDHGDTLHIERVWNGDLERAWDRPIRTERVTPNIKRVTVALDVTANARTTNDEAMWRSALCIALCDGLARAGRVFDIWIVDSTRGPFHASYGAALPPRALWSAWCAKRACDPLVPDRLAAMVSIGFMRTAGFMAMRAGPWRPNSYYGSALDTGLPATLRARKADGEIVLRIGQCYSRKEMIQEYERALTLVEAFSELNATHGHHAAA